jgi:hypothetical protein
MSLISRALIEARADGLSKAINKKGIPRRGWLSISSPEQAIIKGQQAVGLAGSRTAGLAGARGDEKAVAASQFPPG